MARDVGMRGSRSHEGANGSHNGEIDLEMTEEDDEDLIQLYSTIYTNREETRDEGATKVKVQFRTRASEVDFAWFHKKGNRKYAEQLLKSHPVGTYFVRPSSFPDCYAVSYVSHDHSVQHDIIYALHPGFSLEKPGSSPSITVHPSLVVCASSHPHLRFPLPDQEANSSLSSNALESTL